MPKDKSGEEPVFTEKEVDLCLTAAAISRGSYLGTDLKYDADDTRQIEEAKIFDELAAKLAKLASLTELEKQCSDCKDGEDRFGGKCMSCLGTGLWPPTDKSGNRIYPMLRE